MICLLAEAGGTELPLLVADSLSDLARQCGTRYSTVYQAARRGYVTNIFRGIPARIYLIEEDNDNGSEKTGGK